MTSAIASIVICSCPFEQSRGRCRRGTTQRNNLLHGPSAVSRSNPMMTLRRVARFVSVKLLALALIALPVVFAGCTLKSGGFIISEPVNVRGFNALVDGGQVTVTIGDNTVAGGLPFEGLTTYQGVDSGTQEIKVTVGSGSTIVDTTTLLIDGSKYTYLIYGTSAAPTAQLVPDAA